MAWLHRWLVAQHEHGSRGHFQVWLVGNQEDSSIFVLHNAQILGSVIGQFVRFTSFHSSVSWRMGGGYENIAAGIGLRPGALVIKGIRQA